MDLYNIWQTNKQTNKKLSTLMLHICTYLLSGFTGSLFFSHVTSPAASSSSHCRVICSFSTICWLFRTFTNLYGYSEKRTICYIWNQYNYTVLYSIWYHTIFINNANFVCFLLGNSRASEYFRRWREESILHSEHGKSLKSKMLIFIILLL